MESLHMQTGKFKLQLILAHKGTLATTSSSSSSSSSSSGNCYCCCCCWCCCSSSSSRRSSSSSRRSSSSSSSSPWAGLGRPLRDAGFKHPKLNKKNIHNLLFKRWVLARPPYRWVPPFLVPEHVPDGTATLKSSSYTCFLNHNYSSYKWSSLIIK